MGRDFFWFILLTDVPDLANDSKKFWCFEGKRYRTMFLGVFWVEYEEGCSEWLFTDWESALVDFHGGKNSFVSCTGNSLVFMA